MAMNAGLRAYLDKKAASKGGNPPAASKRKMTRNSGRKSGR